MIVKSGTLNLFGTKETVEVSESTIVRLWLKEKARSDPFLFLRLIEDNSKRLERLFGAGVMLKTEKIWTLEEQGVIFFIASSDKEGSKYFIHYVGGTQAYIGDRKMGTAVCGFLERLLQIFAGSKVWA